MKKTINTQIVLTDLNKKPLKIEGEITLTVGGAIAQILVNARQKPFDSFKSFKLGQIFYNDPFVELDDSDFNNLKICIENAGKEVFIDLIVGQILEVIYNVEVSSKPLADQANT